MDNKATIGFSVLAFLVVVLVAFFLVSSYQRQHTHHLGHIVSALTAPRYDDARIDRMMQDLYAAGNDLRLFRVTLDRSRFEGFSLRMAGVSLALDSLKDKKAKAGLFTEARLLADSLARLSARTLLQLPAAPPPPAGESSVSGRTTPDTVKAEAPEAGREREKGLFKRVMDAIRNKPEGPAGKPSVTKEVVRERVMATAEELAMLQANERLFLQLKELLEALKVKEQTLAKRQEKLLGADAEYTLGRIHTHNLWEQGLIFLLAAIILTGIWHLYKNDRAMLRAKEEAEKYAVLKSDFASTMSHEIRTPLQSITGHVELLLQRPADKDQQEIVQAIKLSSDMLLSVVNNILDYTRIEKGADALLQTPFSPAKVVEEVTGGLAVLAEKKHLVLRTELRMPEGTMLAGDAFQLKQVLINLINNAIKYTQKGRVEARVALDRSSGEKAESGSFLKITVRDTGIGMPETALKGIFEEFRQIAAPGEEAVRQHGSGLGLAIVKKIVELHKGSLSVESTLGKGSAFHVSIPYKVLKAAEITRGEVPAPSLSHLKILIVDNDFLNRKYLDAVLQQEGASCLSAAGGAEALELLRTQRVDLVLTDLNMPGMTGVELVRQIRGMDDGKNSSVPVIAVTGTILQGEAGQDVRSCFAGYLVKPYTRQQLISLVKDCPSRCVSGSYL